MVALGVVVAVVSIHTSRAIARKKQTADLLFASRNDERLQRGYDLISEYNSAADKNIRSLAAAPGSEEADNVRYVLNHFEAVSVGIGAGIYDEAMLKKSWCTIILTTFERSQPFISEIRRVQQKATILQEFEWLALRWQKNPLKQRKP